MSEDMRKAIAVERRRRITELLQPTPVRLNHVPNWFRLRLLKAFGCSDRDTSGFGVLQHAIRSLPSMRWLDHWGSTIFQADRSAFVSEPYDFTWEAAQVLQALCQPTGLHWHLDVNSAWNPGRTLRIVIPEPKPK